MLLDDDPTILPQSDAKTMCQNTERAAPQTNNRLRRPIIPRALPDIRNHQTLHTPQQANTRSRARRPKLPALGEGQPRDWCRRLRIHLRRVRGILTSRHAPRPGGRMRVQARVRMGGGGRRGRVRVHRRLPPRIGHVLLPGEVHRPRPRAEVGKAEVSAVRRHRRGRVRERLQVHVPVVPDADAAVGTRELHGGDDEHVHDELRGGEDRGVASGAADRFYRGFHGHVLVDGEHWFQSYRRGGRWGGR
mmetsp:Transcript_5883/g.14730  ORF Transcript_5883/g.14730 Transcript_5883/m.14730 type:complete len:247 (+) Transcript_5883:203-943(+)